MQKILLIVLWLGLGAFTHRAWVQSLVWKLRYLKLHVVAKQPRPRNKIKQKKEK